MKQKIDFKEIEALKRGQYNFELVQRHIKRLENAINQIAEIIKDEKMPLIVKVARIASIIKVIKEYV